MKDKQGQVIGFEKMNFSAAAPQSMRIAFEAVSI
ncbi:MAG: hypothetical protein EHM72_17250 [Calditrichaeota bacterium]|nr:MAG: hypothetical protein EHM72_17250 [Calditrichota bacterium]